MEFDVILFWLEIVVLVTAVFLIVFSLFKQTLTQEALSSISGGSQRLFLHKKVKLSSSLLWIVLFASSLFLVSVVVTIRIVNNINF